MAVNVGQISSDVFGIVGTGVSLGVLTGMAGMTMRAAESLYPGGRTYGPQYGPREREYRRRTPYKPYRSSYGRRQPRQTSLREFERREAAERRGERREFGRGFYRPSFGPCTFQQPRIKVPNYWNPMKL